MQLKLQTRVTIIHPYTKKDLDKQREKGIIANEQIKSFNKKTVTIEQFIYLNLAMMVLISLIFMWGRRESRNPTKLNMYPPEAQNQKEWGDLSLNQKNSLNESLREIPSDQLKNLNPFFMYNGHSWDAFEVLGVAPGSSLDQIKKAFEESLAKTDSNSHDFLKTALMTILSELKKHGFKP